MVDRTTTVPRRKSVKSANNVVMIFFNRLVEVLLDELDWDGWDREERKEVDMVRDRLGGGRRVWIRFGAATTETDTRLLG